MGFIKAIQRTATALLFAHLAACSGGPEGLASSDALAGSDSSSAAARGGNGCKSTGGSCTSTSSTAPLTYSVGGTLSGLNSGASLVLKDNGGDALTLSANGAFTFATKLVNAALYSVTVATQPVGQTCSVTSGSGTINAANVTNVSVVCVTAVTSTPSTAKLLFKTNFGSGVTLADPTGLGSLGAWQPLKGTDATTGFSFPVAALGSDFTGLQLIGPYNASTGTGTPITTSNVSSYFGNAIQSVTGPGGTAVNELFMNLKIKEEPFGQARSQIPFIIKRPWTIGDINTLYVSYWFKHPANLATLLDGGGLPGGWRTQFEFKTGGYLNDWPGDYRTSTVILRNSTDGSLYWQTKGDNVANGPWARVDYWTVNNKTVPVPVGVWFKFEVYWHRSSGSDGRYWTAVNGQVIADHWGPNMGNYNLPITRLMPHVAYTGGNGPVQGHMAGFELWDTFPCGEGKSCYGVR